jgi:hypothetical protein
MKTKISSLILALIILGSFAGLGTIPGCAVNGQAPTTQQVLQGFQIADSGFTIALIGYETGLDVLWAQGKVSPANYENAENNIAIALNNLYAFRAAYTEALASNDPASVQAQVLLNSAITTVAADIASLDKSPTGVQPSSPPPVSLPVISPPGSTQPSGL